MSAVLAHGIEDGFSLETCRFETGASNVAALSVMGETNCEVAKREVEKAVSSEANIGFIVNEKKSLVCMRTDGTSSIINPIRCE